VRSRYPPPSLKQLEDVLHEEWYNIPLETIQNLHESIPRRIQAVLQANGGPAILMKNRVSFTVVFIILSIPYDTKIRLLHTLDTIALIFLMWNTFLNALKHVTVHPPLHHHC
jgi:hypothetical protein